MQKFSALAVFGSILVWGASCAVYKVKPTDPRAAALAESEAAHDHEHVKDAEGRWTCPHEGGDYSRPGKCPNSWCGLDLVPLKKK